MATEPNQLNKEPLKIEFDSESFFGTAKKLCVIALDGDWGTALDAALNGFTNNGSAGDLAKFLINTTLLETVNAVLSGNSMHREIVNKLASEQIRKENYTEDLLKRFIKIEISIDPDFFAAPQTHPFTKKIRAIFRDWLIGYLRFSEHQADALSATLPYQFTRQLAKEWNGKEEFYKTLITWRDNPFFPAYKKLQQQAAYKADLLGLYARSAFDDARIALAEMYEAPYFRVHNRCIPDDGRNKFYEKKVNENSTLERQDEFLKPRTKKNLHEYLLEVIANKNPINLPAEAKPLTLLLGQPGQGKTSFCYHTLHQLLEKYTGKKEQVYFVRLKSITNFEDLIADPLETLSKFISKQLFGESKVMEMDNWENAFLILDGLDELCMNKSLSKDQVHSFITNLRTDLENYQQYQLRTLLTSRYNYVTLKDLPKDKLLVLRLDELRLNQQINWLGKYKNYQPICKLTKALLKKINKGKEKQHKELRKLVNQPILLQIIAQSNFEIDYKANRSQIYKNLFDTILNRKWDDGKIDKFDKLQPLYRKFLRVLALHIYQSDYEYARRSDFEKEGELKNIVERIRGKSGNEKLQIKDIVKDLLVNFYFQEVSTEKEDIARIDENENYAFEFLHKSLQEYLVAEHIWETFKVKFLAKEEDEYRVQTAKQALEILYPLFWAKFLNKEIVYYIRENAKNEKSNEGKNKLYLQLQSLFPKLVIVDFMLPNGNVIKSPINIALSIFQGYWTILSSLLLFKKLPPATDSLNYELNFNKGLDKKTLGKEEIRMQFVHLLFQLQRINNSSLILSHQNLKEAFFTGLTTFNLDFRGANLSHSALNGIFSFNADFSFANLENAQLMGSIIYSTRFNGCKLIKANLNRVELNFVNFNEADCRDITFHSAILKEVNFAEADLMGANFKNAQFLRNVKFKNAKNLHLANFKGTIYEGKFKNSEAEQEEEK